MGSQQNFIHAVASRDLVRPRVAGIIIRRGYLLVQRPAGDPSSCYAFPGGEYEVGDTFETRMAAEIDEETTACMVSAEYLFVVENRFNFEGKLIQGLEHFIAVEIDRDDVTSCEDHLCFHWLPIDRLSEYDLRPHVARDAVASGDYLRVKHLQVPLAES